MSDAELTPPQDPDETRPMPVQEEATAPDPLPGTEPMQAQTPASPGPSKPSDSHYAPELPLPEDLQAWMPQGEYIIERFLGQGGMGAVYKGLQMSLRRPVAIKILAKRQTGEEDDFAFEERFKREAYAMATLTHPHIVQVYDCGDAGEHHLFISMELVEGGDLSDAIKEGRLTTEAALKFIPQICEGMQAAHERGLVHRDIKPANIFMTKDGRAKVADFGLAKKFNAKSTFVTKVGMGMGTPDYAAPEQYDGVPDLDHRADIYALGVMMYQMLTGRLPRGANYKTPSQIVGVDARIDAVVAKAMANERDERYQSAAEIAADLAAILTSTPTPAVSIATPAPARAAPTPTAQSPRAAVSNAKPATPTPRRVATPAPHKAAEPPLKKRGGAGATMAILGTVVVLAVGGWFVFKPKPTAATFSKAIGDPAVATKEAPFINTLGMKFVPVPGSDVLFCIHETRYKDYAAYAGETPGVDGTWKNQTFDGIVITGRPGDHPVANVSWRDAKAFCQWLSQKEGQTYRLPTDHEWSYAVGIGDREKWDADTTPMSFNGKIANEYPWGQWPPTKSAGNYGDESRMAKGLLPPNVTAVLAGYDDGYPTTAPVMSFTPNKLGLYDLGGNVWEWCEDSSPTKGFRVCRGRTWADAMGGAWAAAFLSSGRGHAPEGSRIGGGGGSSSNGDGRYGFRVVLVPPFINSLGMQFVPVPITGGPTNGQRVLFSIWDTRVQDYEVFSKETKQKTTKAEFEQGPTHPAVMVSWDDAQLFCKWLTERDRKARKIGANEVYRLPSDHEWSCAAGIGGMEDPAKSPEEKNGMLKLYPWGTRPWPPPQNAGNYAGEEYPDGEPGYRDAYVNTSPVGSFPGNAFGLYDMGGNAWQWCEDAAELDKNKGRVLRGGSWLRVHSSRYMLSARIAYPANNRRSGLGFRCVLASNAPPSASTPAEATKEKP